MRLFLAINPPEEIRHEIWESTAGLRDKSPSISWTGEARIHLTLKFLGEQPDSAIGPLREMMMRVASSHAPPLIQLSTVGAFPNFRRPRVIWMGIEPDPRLELLHHDVEVACAALGFELEGRPFRPHLTLGRVRQPVTGATAGLSAAAGKVRFTREFHARSIDLMQSHSGPAGSPYTLLFAAPMRGT